MKILTRTATRKRRSRRCKKSRIILVPTLLLAVAIPRSHSWTFFRKLPPPSSSPSSEKSLAEVTKDAIENALFGPNIGKGGSSVSNTRSSTTEEQTTSSSTMTSPTESFIVSPHILDDFPKFLTETFPSFLKALFFYKPPVGITSAYLFFKLILSRNKKLVSLLLLNEEEEQRQMERQTKMRKKRIGRSLELDEADGKMLIGLGGVEAVRTELCLAAIQGYIISNDIISSKANGSQSDNDVGSAATATARQQVGNVENRLGEEIDWNQLNDPRTLSYYATAAKDALKINAAPMSSREDFIERTIEPLVRLQSLHDIREQYYSTMRQIGNLRRKIDKVDVDIVWMASTVAEVRTMDALIRVLRDRLVLSAVRLSRKDKYRVWRLQWYENGIGRYWKRWMRETMKKKTIEDDRRNLQLTRAALKREMERLGQVQQLLLSRPCELSETRLLTSVEATVDEIDNVQTHFSENSTMPEISSTFNSVNCIDAAGARLALLRSDCEYSGDNKTKEKQSNTDAIENWTLEAREWTLKSRAVICDLVTETISDVFQPSSCLTRGRESSVETDLNVFQLWSIGRKSDAEGWNTVLALVDNLSKARLMREHKYLPTAIDLKYWLKRLDFWNIPSSLIIIVAALIVHNSIKPYWSEILKGAEVIGKTTWGVIEFRFVNPLRDIVLDLLNKRPKLLDPFSLSNEEKSLDNMLRDLKIGDGTKQGRTEALAAASRMYEKELAQGAIWKMFSGEMVRLLLIQVQQMKTGLLQAMGSIDDLMDSNRLNVQLLATIPAILLVTFGWRIFVRAMYSLRSKDIVGLPSAHAEMKDLLMKMERCLLLASFSEDNNFVPTGDSASKRRKNDFTDKVVTFLNQNELGEFVLYMHSYLVIMDYCSPPFPSKACDAIHSELQVLLKQGQLSTKRQISLLQLIGAKHDDLLQSIY